MKQLIVCLYNALVCWLTVIGLALAMWLILPHA